jgi:hypothetical protein
MRGHHVVRRKNEPVPPGVLNRYGALARQVVTVIFRVIELPVTAVGDVSCLTVAVSVRAAVRIAAPDVVNFAGLVRLFCHLRKRPMADLAWNA